MAYKVFLSSPSDVMAERALCADVVARINADQSTENRLEIFRWEEQYYSAVDTFQTQIPRAGECDLVICIFWKALGTELPEEFRRDDGTTRTGSEFEFEDAIASAEASADALPDILVYKKNEKIFFSEQDLEREQLQYKSFKQFWQRWFYSEKGHFLAAFHTFLTPEEFATLLESHLRQWLANRARDVTWRSGSPYPGLRSFDVRDAPVFFGRRHEIERLRARLIRAAMAGRPFLLVSGPSGSGKSSLVRAGLIPRLAAPGGMAQLGTAMRWALLTPSQIEADPDLGLAQAFFADAALGTALASGDFDTPEALADLLRAGGTTALSPLLKALDRIDEAESGLMSSATKLLVLVDQLEELFKWDPDKAAAFLDIIDVLVSRADGRFLVVATTRSDLVHLAGSYPVLRKLTGRDEVKDESSVDTTLEVAAIGAADLRDIIRLPARAAGLSFERDPDSGDDLAQIIESESSPSLLPAVQYLLSELYERRRDTVLTRDAYRTLGGVRAVMAERGEAVLAELGAEAQSAFPHVFRGLVKFDTGDGPPTARRLPVDAFPDDSPEARLVRALVDARLIITDGRTLRIAHESLFDGWGRLRDLAEQDRRMLGIRDRLLPYAQRYAHAATRSERRKLLLRGFQLAEGRELRRRWGDATLAVADPALPQVVRESDRAEKRRRFGQVAGAWGLVAVFAMFSVSLYQQWSRAETQRIQTLAAFEVVQAQNALTDGRIEDGARHALNGYDLVPSQESRSVLLQTLIEVSPNLLAVRSLPSDALAVAFVDNDILAVADASSTLRFHSVSGDAVPGPIDLAGDARVRDLSALAGGGLAAVLEDASVLITTRSGIATRIDPPMPDDFLMPGQHSVSVTGGAPARIALATFGSGLALATCGAKDDAVSCDWQVRRDRPPPAVVALGHDRLVTASDAYPYTITVDRAEQAETLSVAEDRVISLDIAARGGFLAAGTEIGELAVHADSTGAIVRHQPSQTTVPVLRWSPTEPVLALVCDDREICINRTPSMPDSRFERFVGHRQQITDLAWSPDGTRISSVSADGTLRVWSLGQVPGPRRVLRGTGVGLPALAIDRATGKLAAGADDGSVLVWTHGVRVPRRLPAPEGASGRISALVWTSDGKLAGALGDAGELVRWSDDGGTPVVTKLGAAFHRIAAVGDDGSVAVPMRDGQVVRVDAAGNTLTLAAPPFDDRTRPTPWGALAHPGGKDVIVSYSDGSYFRHPLDGSEPEVFLTLDDTKIAIGAGSLSVSSEGSAFAASQGDHAVSVYPIDGGAAVIRRRTPSRDTRVVTFEPDGDRLAVLGSDGWLSVYQLGGGNLVPVLGLDPVATRSRAGRDSARGRSAQWLEWAGHGQLALSTAAGDIHLISLDEDIWRRRVADLVGQTEEKEP